jgi:hypothetical protein
MAGQAMTVAALMQSKEKISIYLSKRKPAQKPGTEVTGVRKRAVYV